MTTIELRDRLNKLMKDIPNTANDEIYFFDKNMDEPLSFDEIVIEFDLNQEGRYICLE